MLGALLHSHTTHLLWWLSIPPPTIPRYAAFCLGAELNEFSIELTFTINESVADDGVEWTEEEMTNFRAWADK